MGDMADDFKAMREQRKRDREQRGCPCSTCVRERPLACATILLPGQRCRVCGNRDQRQVGSPDWKEGL